MTGAHGSETVPVRAAIVGAGGIGGSLAAHLIDGGWTDLLLVDADAAHVAAINTSGLHLAGAGVDIQVEARAVTPDQLTEPLDLVFLCVKSQHTASALTAVAPVLSADGCVVSVQNGLNIDSAVAGVGEGRVIPGFVNWAADYLSPGRILFGGRSHFVLGEWGAPVSPRLERIGAMLDPAFPAVLTDDIVSYLWSKQVSIALMFSAGISHRSIPEAFDDPDLAPLFSRLAEEGAAVAAAAGATLTLLDDFDPVAYASGAAVEAMRRTADHYRSMDKQHTGLYRDLAIRQRPAEVDGTLGVTIAHARQHGIDCRGHESTVEFVHDIEQRRRTVGEASLLALRERVAALGPLITSPRGASAAGSAEH